MYSVLTFSIYSLQMRHETLDTAGQKYFIIENDYGKRSKTHISRVNNTRSLATSVDETLFDPFSPPEYFMEETAT